MWSPRSAAIHTPEGGRSLRARPHFFCGFRLGCLRANIHTAADLASRR